MSTIQFPSAYPVTAHTDFVGQGSTFVAMHGAKFDGASFIALALQKGAKKIVVQIDSLLSPDTKQLILQHHAELEYVSDCRQALAEQAAQALNFPAKKLKIIAVTGTKGKTSTAYMAYHMLYAAGKAVALISTVEKRIGADIVDIPLTTPQPDQIHMFLHLCVERNIEFVVMEVSAQALTLHRVNGIEFEAGVFTNFSHEHLEFYKDMQQYFAAKKMLFAHIKNQKNMFVNIDDSYCLQLQKEYPQASSFSLQNHQANVYGFVHREDKQNFVRVQMNNQEYDFFMPILGTFNVYNLLGVVSMLNALNIDLHSLKFGLQKLPHVPGRMEQYILKNGAQCFIDYAHNPSSYEAVLSTLRSMTSHLIVVFGAAGNRDKQKRPIMGALAQKYCDVVILTSDNPRDENPIVIAQEVEAGFDQNIEFEFHKELNRVKAIELGCFLAKDHSIVAILGKGRDEYQIVGGLTFPFKERSIIRPYLKEND
ncbi:UDP-N-acetylmuramoyl-L-alanyl-D-glutamate--2,6-diaminopimelate ligase [Candidatus Babeliales bacterium]|nr:UDP-N-acetylmuramoyl-L-alanyl-D-glutamate--2,6-diaminopimelate ligase [Candidatus Babeliales bacterium]